MGTPTSQTPPLPLPLREGDYFEAVRGAGNYRVQAQDGSVVQATPAVKGVARTATPAEAVAGGVGELFVSPAGVAAAVETLLSTRIVAGEGVETEYAGGVLTISPVGGGGGGESQEFLFSFGSYYAWNDIFPSSGFGEAVTAGNTGTPNPPFFPGGESWTPQTWLGYDSFGFAFVRNLDTGVFYFVVHIDGPEGFPSNFTAHSALLGRTFHSVDAQFGVIVTAGNYPAYAWEFETWEGPGIDPGDNFASGAFVQQSVTITIL